MNFLSVGQKNSKESKQQHLQVCLLPHSCESITININNHNQLDLYVKANTIMPLPVDSFSFSSRSLASGCIISSSFRTRLAFTLAIGAVSSSFPSATRVLRVRLWYSFSISLNHLFLQWVTRSDSWFSCCLPREARCSSWIFLWVPWL